MIYFTSHFKTPKKEEFRGYFTKHGLDYKFLTQHSPPPMNLNPDKDVLFTWNRFTRFEKLASHFQNVGCKIIVMENPYFHVPDEISLGLYFHNNKNYSIDCLDNGDRFLSKGITINPWKRSGDYILVCTQSKHFNQSGIGHVTMRQPFSWDEMVIKHLRRYTDKKILFKPHPRGFMPNIGKVRAIARNVEVLDKDTPLSQVLPNCYATVVHTSNAATESLLAGVPVIYTGSTLFMATSCNHGIQSIQSLVYPDTREENFKRMAWNQYHFKEFSDGSLFNILDILK